MARLAGRPVAAREVPRCRTRRRPGRTGGGVHGKIPGYDAASFSGSTGTDTGIVSGKRVNRVLLQESPFKGEVRRFEIYNDKFVKVEIRNVFGELAYHINMSLLEPWPVFHRQIAWPWLLAVIYFGTATLVYGFWLWRHPDGQTLARLLPFMVLFTLLTLGALLMFLYRSPNVLEFRSRYGGCPLIGLLNNKPDKAEFRHFRDELKTRVLAASQAITFDKRQMRSIELQELRRLNEQGAIDDIAFRKARDRAMRLQI